MLEDSAYVNYSDASKQQVIKSRRRGLQEEFKGIIMLIIHLSVVIYVFNSWIILQIMSVICVCLGMYVIVDNRKQYAKLC